MINKIISYISPEMALKREIANRKFNFLNSGYSHHGASTTKKSFLGWRSESQSPEEDINDNLERLRDRSRDLYMGAPLATGALKTLRTNVVGTGLKLNCQIDHEFLGLSSEEAQSWEDKTEREFSLWAESIYCDSLYLSNFYQIQGLIFLSSLMSGDSFSLLQMKPIKNFPYDLRLAVIEADRVCNPNSSSDSPKIYSGVERDESGSVTAYHIAQKHPKSKFAGFNKWDRVSVFGEKSGRRNILHILDQERAGQIRGVPVLAPVIESLKQLSRYSEAELMAAVVSGMFTVFIESQTPSSPVGSFYEGSDSVATSENDYEMGNGAIVAMNPGEKMNVANPGRPNTAFEGFVVAICRQIGSALEIPYELLVKNFLASYSASRAALLEAWKMFRMRRAWLVSSFCQPVYEEWLTEAILKGRIQAPGFFDDPIIKKSWAKADWNGPSQGQIDPLKEVNAAKIRVEEGFSTCARETAELTGGNFESNMKIRVREQALKKEAGLIQEVAPAQVQTQDQNQEEDQ